MGNRIKQSFFNKGALEIAPLLLGKFIVRKFNNDTSQSFMITEVEAYCGEEDLACHASKGRTNRTEVMYHPGGVIYVYLIYGIHWMLNFVCGEENNPQAVLIRGINKINGPGKVGSALKIDKSFYGEDLNTSQRIWIEDNNTAKKEIHRSNRIGIEYAGELWKNKKYRFFIST